MKKKGFILLEIIIVVFLVTVISLSISGMIYNMGVNRAYVNSMINLDSILWEDASRARSKRESKRYEGITVSRVYTYSENFLGMENLIMTYINIKVVDNVNGVHRSTIVVRSG